MFGQVLKVFKGHTGLVGDVAISTDGAKIVSGSWDKTVRVWSMETGEVLDCFLVIARILWLEMSQSLSRSVNQFE